MFNGKIVVARIATNTHDIIVNNYHNYFEDSVGKVLSFPNPCYINSLNSKKVFIVPWYLFIEVEGDLDYETWEKKEKFLYYFVKGRDGSIIDVPLEEFEVFYKRADEISKFNSRQEDIKDFIGRYVRIRSEVFGNRIGVIKAVKKDRLEVVIETPIKITLMYKPEELELL